VGPKPARPDEQTSGRLGPWRLGFSEVTVQDLPHVEEDDVVPLERHVEAEHRSLVLVEDGEMRDHVDGRGVRDRE